MKKTGTPGAFVLLTLALCSPAARADTSASRNYTVIADTVDAAGGNVSSITYASQASLGGIGGSSSGTVGRTTVSQGYIGQLGEIPVSSVIPPPAAPVLTLLQSGSAVILSWPGVSTGFTLETADDLLPAINWQPAATTPIWIDGKFAVTNQLSGFSRFYRLRSP